MINEGEPLATSEDAVLGGRLVLRQPLRGHRVGHDAILLAAATAARAGEYAVDLGAGVGAAGLALARRVEGLTVSLVEIDPTLYALAAGNARRNGLHARVTAVACNAEDAQALASAGLRADRVLMNPPFRDAVRENVSPDPRRRLAHVAAPGALRRWTASATSLLKPGGVLTLIWPADRLDDVLAVLADDYGKLGVLPVFPRPDRPAIRVLVRAAKEEPAGRIDHPPLMLNDASGRPTTDAEAVLRGGGILSLAAM